MLMNPFRNGLVVLLAALVIVPVCGVSAQVTPVAPAAPESRTQSPTGKWQFSDGPEFPGATGGIDVDANGRVTMSYDFAGGGNYVAVYTEFDPPAHANSISARIKKPYNSELTVRMMDSTGQMFQKSFYYDSDQWREVELTADQFAFSYGGAADGNFHQPIRQFHLLAENRGLDAAAGQIMIEDVQANLVDPEAAGSGQDGPAYDQGASLVSYLVTDFKNDPLFYVKGPSAFDAATGRWSADLGKAEQVELGHSISLLGEPKELELVVRGGNPGNLVIIHLGSHFQTFGRAVGMLNGQEQTFRFTMPPEGWDFWGGENDGVPLRPLRFSGFVLAREKGPAESANVELVRLSCITSVPNSKAINLSSGISARTSQASPLDFTTTVTGRNLLESPVKGTLSLKVLDWDEHVVFENKREVTMPAGGQPLPVAIDFSIPRELLFLEAIATFEAEGQVSVDAVATWTSPVKSQGDTTLRPEMPWGMGVYLYRYDLSPEGLRRMDKAAEMAQQAGVKWTREEFSWERLEPKRGQFDFEYYDKMVDTALAHGISVYGLLAYWSDFTEPYTEEGIDDFVTYTRAMVRHFKDRVHHWEIYNEPNIFFWQGPKELYPVLLERCYTAIKDEDPGAMVLGCSTSGIDRGFIEQVVKADAPFDILTIHPYRSNLSEIQFINELRSTARMVGGRSVWITEMGWPTQIGGTSQREQAEYLGRCYLSMAISGVCNNMGWYNFRNDGSDPYYNEHNFGVLNFDLSPKPAYRALATVCNGMNSGTPKQRTDFGPDVWAVEMGGTVAIWSNRGDYKIRARVLRGEPKVVNLMGDPLDVKPESGVLALTIESKKPVFISGASVEADGPAEALDLGQNDILQF